jgi:alkylation response protein AidB-like acyl-CoA dehydrogenase
MDFRITEEQELLLQSLEEHLQREAPESLMASLDEQKVFPYKPWKSLADFGILALGVPEEYGGTPVDIMTMTLVTELLGGKPSRLASSIRWVLSPFAISSSLARMRSSKRCWWLCSRRCAGCAGHHRATGRLRFGCLENQCHDSTATM